MSTRVVGLAIVFGMVAGCEYPRPIGGNPAAPARHAVAPEPDEVSKTAYLNEMRNHLATFDATLAEWDRRMQATKGERRTQMQQAMAELKVKRAAFATQITRLTQYLGVAWSRTKTDTDLAYAETSKAFIRATPIFGG